MQQPGIDRRTFLQGVSALGVFRPAPSPRFLYIGANDAILSFSLHNGRTVLEQRLPSRSPAALALHPNRHILYAAAGIKERGSVEAYRIEPANGRLLLLAQRSLSLSASGPRSLAVSPDGAHLVAAASSGGIYNVFPLTSRGAPDSVASAFKEIGSGPRTGLQDTAHPHSVGFHPSGRFLIGSDLGADRLSLFTVTNREITRTSRHSVAPGAGPGHLVIHPSGSFFYVLHEFAGVISCYRLFANAIGPAAHAVAVPPGPGTLAIDSSGRFLYSAAKTIAAWKINLHSGSIVQIDSCEDSSSVRALCLCPATSNLFVVDDRGTLLQLPVDPSTGRFGSTLTLTRVSSPLALALA
jgi:6-phosphogluconolactonase